jgi:hypothetical protein
MCKVYLCHLSIKGPPYLDKLDAAKWKRTNVIVVLALFWGAWRTQGVKEKSKGILEKILVIKAIEKTFDSDFIHNFCSC